MDNVILNQNIHFKFSFSFDLLPNIRYSSLVFVIQQPSIGVAFVVVVLGLYIWS